MLCIYDELFTYCFYSCGDAIETLNGVTLLKAPPIGILIGQEYIEKASITIDGVSKETSYVEQTIMGVVCQADEKGVNLIPITTRMDLTSPSSRKYNDHVNVLPISFFVSFAYTWFDRGHKKRCPSYFATSYCKLW
jgi:hypothetical protein